MNRVFLRDFDEIYLDEENLKSYRTYYIALCNWINSKRRLLGDELINRKRLNILLSLNVYDYATEEIKGNGMSLSREKERMSDLNNCSLDSALSAVSNTLWDIVTTSSVKLCVRCTYGDLRYIKINYTDTDGKVVLECKDCGALMNLDGSVCSDKIDNYIPATKEEIEMAIGADLS